MNPNKPITRWQAAREELRKVQEAAFKAMDKIFEDVEESLKTKKENEK